MWNPELKSAWFMNARALAAASAFAQSEVGARRATMEITVSHMPPNWGFLVSAGITQLTRMIERIAPATSEVQIAEQTGAISPILAGQLLTVPCAVDVNAPPEGTLLFAGDTAATIEGPLWQAWILAHVARDVLHAATSAATRAARLVIGARGTAVVDGASCQAASGETAVSIARSAYVGGVAHTQSTVAAARLDIPLRVAPSPDAVALMGTPSGSRLSGWNFAQTTGEVLVGLGPGEDEEESLADLQRMGVRTGGWVSHALGAPCPELQMRCDLAALEQGGIWTPRLGAIPDISCVPGRKLVIRYSDATGRPIADIIHGIGERIQPAATALLVGYQQTGVAVPLQGATTGVPLLSSAIRSGTRVGPDEELAIVRERARNSLQFLLEAYKRMRHPSVFPVGMSPSIARLKADLLTEICGV